MLRVILYISLKTESQCTMHIQHCNSTTQHAHYTAGTTLHHCTAPQCTAPHCRAINNSVTKAWKPANLPLKSLCSRERRSEEGGREAETKNLLIGVITDLILTVGQVLKLELRLKAFVLLTQINIVYLAF